MEEGNRKAAFEIFSLLASIDPANEEWVSLLERLDDY